jgi:hypothetical protein
MKLDETIVNLENRLEKIDKPYMVKLVQSLYNFDPENFLLVKLGANDGWMCDNLYDFVIENDPHAIMVEPIPCYFDVLKNNFSSLKNTKYEQVAIDINGGNRDMTYIHEDKFVNGEITFRLEHMPELFKEHWARGLGSFYKDKNNLGCPELSKYASTINVTTMTISELFEKYSITNKQNIVVVTDCEGHDYEILKSFDFGAYKPVIYISEIELFTRYPSSHPRKTNYINDELNPGKRKPPEGVDIKVNMSREQYDYIMNNTTHENRAQYVQKLLKLGYIKDASGELSAELAQRVKCLFGAPEEEEYYQLNGLYTPDEFKDSINILELAGYTMLRQGGEDLVAVESKFLNNLRSYNVI